MTASNGHQQHHNGHEETLWTKWIDWKHPLVQSLWFDPTRIFSFLVNGIMMARFIAAKMQGSTSTADGQVVQVEPMGFSDAFLQSLFGFFLHPYVMLFWGMATVSLYWGLKVRSQQQEKQQSQSTSLSSLLTCWTTRLSLEERWIVEWYWWNAWLYHMTMDGASGSLEAIPVVVQQYRILDLRFPQGNVMPYMIGMVELFVHGPCCMITLYCVLTKHAMRFPMEIITGVLHITGMVLFVAGELYEEQIHVPALDPVGIPGDAWHNVRLLDAYHLVYYWFGFWFCNLIWGVVPYIRMNRAVRECAKAQTFYDDKSSVATSNGTTKQE